MALGKLSAKAIDNRQHPGMPLRPIKVADGNGLFLQITPNQTKSWLLRFTMTGRTREMGLGQYGAAPEGVSLANARKAATEALTLAKQGVDPIDQRAISRRQQDSARQRDASNTFRSVAEAMVTEREKEWRHVKHRQQWRASLINYVYPILGQLSVATITTDDVLDVLRPLWSQKPKTASRVRGRIERVLAYAKARVMRQGDNPAAWRGHLSEALPSPRRIQGEEPGHHPALPWRAIAAFMAELKKRDGVAARALEVLILTAGRSTEILQARWSEIDFDTGIWAIPASRMKAKRDHRVALADNALDVLRHLLPLSAGSDSYVFPGTRVGSPLSSMALLMLLRRMNRVEEGKPPGGPTDEPVMQSPRTGSAAPFETGLGSIAGIRPMSRKPRWRIR